MNNPQNWRQELLLINFFQPLEQAASVFFVQALADKDLRINITHKLDLATGGLRLDVLLSINGMQILNSGVTFKEEQIIMTLQKNPEMDLQTFIALTLFPSAPETPSVCESMLIGLNRVAFKHFVQTKITPTYKPKENVAVDSQIQTHDSGREEVQEGAESSAPASS